jgi:hypothetical protein
MSNEMSDHDAYYKLTRILTNMHCTERDALDQGGWKYRAALDLVKQGKDSDAVELATHFVTIAGQVSRINRKVRFVNPPKLAPHGGCNWSGCSECFPH